MLRRVPTTSDGKVVSKLLESTKINKPFKPPTPSVDRIQPQRKRKRVSYKGQELDGSDSEDENGPKRKQMKGDRDKDGNYHNEEELLAATKKYPVYRPTPFEQISSRRFSMPSMTNKDGQMVALIPTNVALG